MEIIKFKKKIKHIIHINRKHSVLEINSLKTDLELLTDIETEKDFLDYNIYVDDFVEKHTSFFTSIIEKSLACGKRPLEITDLFLSKAAVAVNEAYKDLPEIPIATERRALKVLYNNYPNYKNPKKLICEMADVLTSYRTEETLKTNSKKIKKTNEFWAKYRQQSENMTKIVQKYA